MKDITHGSRDYLSGSETRLIGEILVEAGLITQSQLEVALTDQRQFFKLKLGEILALRGWLNSQTADFLVEIKNKKATKIYRKEYPIGFYLKKAGLLSDEQIKAILQEQKRLGIKFCETAVLKGFLKEETARFFLTLLGTEYCEGPTKNTAARTTILLKDQDYIADNQTKETKRYSHSGLSSPGVNTTIGGQDIIITPQEVVIISGDEAECFYCGGIAYSPISIDH